MELPEHIRKRIDERIANSHDRVGVSAGALSLYADWSGYIAIKPDGSFIFYEWDTGKVTQEDDSARQLRALVVGSQDYPELVELLPVKSDDARECMLCNGAGRLVIEDKVCNNIICGTCFGLGWVTEYILSLSEREYSGKGDV